MIVSFGQSKIIGTDRSVEYQALYPSTLTDSNVLDKICAFLLALAPILQHYKGFIIDLGISVMSLTVIWFSMRLLTRVSQLRLTLPIFGLVLFHIYKSLVHGTSFYQILYALVMIVLYVAAENGVIDIGYYLRVSSTICAIASILIILQYVCYYLLGFHLQLVATQLLLPEAEQWVRGAQTGLIGINGKVSSFYRPSAFFLEPSHMFLYVFPHVFVLLFAPGKSKWRLSRARLLSLGILMTTSGMGLLVVIFAWMAYFALYNNKTGSHSIRNLLKSKNLIIFITFILIVIFAISSVPSLRGSFSRIVDLSNSGAIAGRTRLARQLISRLSKKEKLIGVTDTLSGINFNMPGFYATLYKFGFIGIILSYTVYVNGVFKCKQQYFWISLFVIIVSFFSAHTHGTFYMMYYVFFLILGFMTNRQNSHRAEQERKACSFV